MKNFLVVFFALLALTQAVQHIGLERRHHLQNKVVSEQKSLKASGLSYVTLEGGIETTGEYYATVYLGSDRQSFGVQVDTGSTVLAIPAVGCVVYSSSGSSITPTSTACDHANPFYNYKASSEATPVPYNVNCNTWSGNNTYCEFELTYGDGSFLVGTLISDRVEIGGVYTTAEFGQVQGESDGFAPSGVDGIMGFAYQALDPYDGDDIFGELVTAGQVENSFSMCLGDTGGMLVLGGVDSTYSASSMQYTPIVEETYYVVSVTDVKVGSTSIGASTASYGTSIVDSGTTLFYLASTPYNDLVSTFQTSVCPQLSASLQSICTGSQTIFDPNNCYSLSSSEVNSFPSINIYLSGISTPLTMSPQDYFVSVTDSGTTYQCFGIMDGGSDTIMGDIFMKNYNIHFDRANSRVGFADVQNCNDAATSVVSQMLLLLCLVVLFI